MHIAMVGKTVSTNHGRWTNLRRFLCDLPFARTSNQYQGGTECNEARKAPSSV